MVRNLAVVTGLRHKALFNDANCISLYQFEGTPTIDSKGANTLTNAGTVASAAGGKFGNCADFGATNSTKYFALASAFNILGSQDVSFSFWTKIQTEPGSGATFIQFVHLNNTTTDRYMDFRYRNVSGTKKITVNFSATMTDYTVTLGTTDWHHIAVVRDVTNSKGHVYLDGVKVINNATLGTGAGGVKNFAIGVDPYAGNFSSSFIDDFAVFNRVLTDAEISGIVNDVRNTASSRTTAATRTVASARSLIISSPLEITGCTLWMDADQIVGNDGDLVATWSDTSGTGNNATATGAGRPTLKTNILNGKKVVRFSGSNYMSLTSQSSYNSVFMVLNFTGSTTGYKGLYSRTTADYGIYSNLSTAKKWGLYRNAEISSGKALGTAYRHISVIWRSGSDIDLTTDGIVVNTGGGSPFGYAGNLIGSDEGTQNHVGDIAEIIIYNTALSTANRRSVENYLRVKYALV
jgi:hypothetical protein